MIVKSNSFGKIDNRCYIIIDEKTNKSALVDCTEFSKKMEELIGNTDLEYILLTHGHYDHIMGVEETSKKYGAKVVISENDAPMLSSGKLSLAAFMDEHLNYAKADIKLVDGDELTLGTLKIKAILTKGHTSGGMCYIVEDYIFTGDTLFKLSCGNVNFPTGDENEMAQSLKLLKDFPDDYIVCPGHGDSTTLNFERKNNPYMRTL